MNHYEAVNILDMLNAIGEDAVKNILSDFSCPKNFEIESFVKQNALEFAKRKMSITYLVIDEEGQLAAIFALTHKAVQLTNEGLRQFNSYGFFPAVVAVVAVLFVFALPV